MITPYMSAPARQAALARVIAHLTRELSPELREVRIPIAKLRAPQPDVGMEERMIDGELMLVIALGDEPR